MYLGADRELPARMLTAREIMEQVHAAAGLFVFNHPNWRPWPDYATDGLLDSMKGMRAIEIYNSAVEWFAGEAMATDRWDRLLAKGRRVFGHATDDQHEPKHRFAAWNQVQWGTDEPVTAEGILEALSEGRFYASTGVTMHQVGANAEHSAVTVRSDADAIRWITNDGVFVKRVSASESWLTVDEVAELEHVTRLRRDDPEAVVYVRAECLGGGGAMAWTQPFWLSEES
jgi:hypothetical protein